MVGGLDMDMSQRDQTQQPEPPLPRLYQLLALDSVDSVLDEACRQARQGADEGLLIRARTQTGALGRCGQPWLSPAGALHAALVLRPEVKAETSAELAMVVAVALGSAIAEHVLPLTELHYRWPNDVLLRQGKVGSVQMRWRDDGAGGLEWLAAGFNVNVAVAPSALGFDAAAVQMEGECEVTGSLLLESFGRQFLGWADRWANEGFAPIRKAWLQRAVGIGDDVELEAAGSRHAGRLLDVADDGALLLGRGGAVERISLRDAFSNGQP